MDTKKFSREEKSWIMYDWANSVFATIMMAALFPIYFTGVAGESGDIWWGYGSSAATLVMAILAPIVGALGDRKGNKKKVFIVFWILGMLGTAACALITDWRLLLSAYVVGAIGFSGSCLCYDSFLTDVTNEERMDRVSAWGYAMGYIGGSTIPFLIAIALVMLHDKIGLSNAEAVRISVVITVVWWGLFSIPFLRHVKQKYHTESKGKGVLQETFHNIAHTAKAIWQDKRLRFFVIAYFFYIDGVGTIIKMSTAYGTSLGLGSTGMVLALLVTQIVAVPFAIWFSKLGEKIGGIRVILMGIGVYTLVCILGFIMGFGMEQAFLTNHQALVIFWILAVLVGTSQGGIQAMSRSYFGKMIPKERSNEYFGFFEIFGKFASVMGPLLYSVISTITGRSSYAILSIILLFVIGGGILLAGRKRIEQTEK
ncbi:MAG: MFS transporter [Lachnospiraceae bacterium]|jgi:UMF1 family MFS transporter|nr:MFS transporter [Lachnospiraceae bacterium]